MPADRGIEVRRSYGGEYRTSLGMAGASITLVRLDDEIAELLEAPARIPVGAVRGPPPPDAPVPRTRP